MYLASLLAFRCWCRCRCCEDVECPRAGFLAFTSASLAGGICVRGWLNDTAYSSIYVCLRTAAEYAATKPILLYGTMRDLSLSMRRSSNAKLADVLSFEWIGAEAAEPVVQDHTRGVGAKLCVKGRAVTTVLS